MFCLKKELTYGSETLDMRSYQLGEMPEGDFSDMCAGKFTLMSLGVRAKGLACADPGAMTPIIVSGILQVTKNRNKLDCVSCK